MKKDQPLQYSDLPTELTYYMLHFLDRDSLANASSVCKFWNVYALEILEKQKIIQAMVELFTEVLFDHLWGNFSCVFKDNPNSNLAIQLEAEIIIILGPIFNYSLPENCYKQIAQGVANKINDELDLFTESEKNRLISVFKLYLIFKNNNKDIYVKELIENLRKHTNTEQSKFLQKLCKYYTGMLKKQETNKQNCPPELPKRTELELINLKYQDLVSSLIEHFSRYFLFMLSGDAPFKYKDIRINFNYISIYSEEGGINVDVSNQIALLYDLKQDNILPLIIHKIKTIVSPAIYKPLLEAFSFNLVEQYAEHWNNKKITNKLISALSYLMSHDYLTDPSQKKYEFQIDLLEFTLRYCDSEVIKLLFEPCKSKIFLTKEDKERFEKTTANTFISHLEGIIKKQYPVSFNLTRFCNNYEEIFKIIGIFLDINQIRSHIITEAEKLNIILSDYTDISNSLIKRF